MEKVRISEAQFRKLIREEGEKIKKEIILRAQLDKIDQELAELSEVHAGGNMAPGESGVHAGQKKPVFDKKGTHLVEESPEEEMSSDDMGAEEMPADNISTDDMGAEVSSETPAAEGTETISKDEIMKALQDLGNRLDLVGTVEFTGDGDEMAINNEMPGDEDDSVDLDVDIENGAEDAPGTEEMSSEEVPSEENSDENMDECDDTMEVKTNETTQINESVNPKKQKLNEERERMKFLAGLK